jgi:hypothetical protein
MVTLRRSEKRINWSASESFQFNPEDFRTLSETFDPYEGDSDAEFADYIFALLEYTDVYDVCEELEELNLTAAAETLSSLAESDVLSYLSEVDLWLEQGTVDESYEDTGGFRIDYRTD